MEKETTLYFSEKDIRDILTKRIESEGYVLDGELEITVQSKKDIPKGATAGDVVGVRVKVKSTI